MAMFARRSLEPHETTILSHAIRTLDPDLTTPALIPDLTTFIQFRPATLRTLTLTLTLTHEDENAYDARVQGLLDALISMGPDGLYGNPFSQPTSAHIILGGQVSFKPPAKGQGLWSLVEQADSPWAHRILHHAFLAMRPACSSRSSLDLGDLLTRWTETGFRIARF
ncbi:hypothetical protein H4W26_001652 [Nesterenkonia halotolerans]|uniref:Uncharacterized protein n=1 Tax=Nesterenkonia halotolerans TaxID=225325 RepID=A0ABR9J7B9_9MICC|nr:hypothetical protein [Nesterenkonia halotolerans]